MKIELLKADITEIQVDGIVNAANTSLLGGGGVDGAIHRKGGKAILDECVQIRNKQGGCKTGEAVLQLQEICLLNMLFIRLGLFGMVTKKKNQNCLQIVTRTV